MTQEANDNAQLLPAVDRIEQRLEKKPQQMVADGGYTTRENIEKMAGREIDFLGSHATRRMPSGATPAESTSTERVCLSPETNRYVCPEGKSCLHRRHDARKKQGS